MTAFFTADTHFNHANIIKFCARPFACVNEMNRVLIENWNEVVSDDDVVYHLGDVGFPPMGPILERLRGSIILIEGSHDKRIVRQHAGRFHHITPMLELKPRAIGFTPGIVLCHYAMRTWPRSHFNAWHLYGHSHGRLKPVGKSFDVGVDVHAFRPLSLSDVAKIMDKHPDNPNLADSDGRPRR